jgi:hypothetical protein
MKIHIDIKINNGCIPIEHIRLRLNTILEIIFRLFVRYNLRHRDMQQT